MKDKHILDILDQGLSEENSALIKAHTETCENCRRAAEASRITSVMFRAAEGETFSPSPFFQAKVLNALREKPIARLRSIAAFWRWWQASAALIGFMVITVISLIALSVFAPGTSANDTQAEMTSENIYTTDAVLMHRQRTDLTTEQTLELIYNTKK